MRATFFLSFFVTSNPTCSKLTCTESAAEVKTLGGGAICVLAHPHHPLIDLPESLGRPGDPVQGDPVRVAPRRFASLVALCGARLRGTKIPIAYQVSDG